MSKKAKKPEFVEFHCDYSDGSRLLACIHIETEEVYVNPAMIEGLDDFIHRAMVFGTAPKRLSNGYVPLLFLQSLCKPHSPAWKGIDKSNKDILNGYKDFVKNHPCVVD